MKIEQPTVLLKCNHYIKCFCFIQIVAKILTKWFKDILAYKTETLTGPERS
jgi:hypothetical protein